MDSIFAQKFQEWSLSHEFSIVSGSDIDKLKVQIPQEILQRAVQIFSCNGSDIWKYDGTAWSNLAKKRFKFPTSLKDFLEFELQYANWVSPRFEPHIENRPGLVNFSILGRKAPQEWRDRFEAWDIQDGTRKRQCHYINSKYPELHASAGGQISIDIVHKDATKAQILNHIDLKEYLVEFYADKINGGNDESLAKKITELGCGFSTNVTGPKDVAILLNFGE